MRSIDFYAIRFINRICLFILLLSILTFETPSSHWPPCDSYYFPFGKARFPALSGFFSFVGRALPVKGRGILAFDLARFWLGYIDDPCDSVGVTISTRPSPISAN